MEKIRVSIDGGVDEDTEIFEGYTDNILPSPSIALAKKEVIRFLDSSPYDYRFLKHGGIPFLRVYKGERYEDVPSTSVPTDDGEVQEGYFMDGLGLVEIE
jgi:hypothetical protein